MRASGLYQVGRLWICVLEVSADALVVLGALPIQGAGETHRKWFLVELTHPPYPSLMAIRGPIPTEEGENRFVRCEQELEAEFQALVWKAVAAGWDEGEACVAIASLADHHILAMHFGDQTSVAIRKLKG
ncbi:hypothetical protein [Shinella lacus]|uniref:hypothetical protein n=1 Tax=Shinella lacus TaxID=2654216 RepID=UPI00272DF279|nr:hypothetical protein [Shinella lacus]